MAKNTTFSLPVTQRALKALGENLRLARLRRGLSALMVSERAGLSRPTLRSLERGEGSVSLTALANVLLTLGLEKDLEQVAHDDVLGRKLQDIALTTKRRITKRV